MRLLVLLLLLLPFRLFAADDYLLTLQGKVEKATTFSQKLNAYENWLAVAILVHHPDAERSLNEFNVLIKQEHSELGEGIYDLNLAYFITETLGDYSKGLDLCLKAKDIFEKLDARPQLVMTYNRLAFIVLWNQIGKKEAVLKENLYNKYLAKAYQLAVELNDSNLQVASLSYIGSYYIVSEKDYPKSLSYFYKAEKLLSPGITPYYTLGVVGSIIIVFAEMNDEANMLRYLKKIENDPYFAIFGYGKSNVYRSVAKYYFNNNKDKKNYSEALLYAEKAYDISLQMKAPEYISQGAQLLYQIYKAMGDDKVSLFYLEKYKTTEDSLARERFQKTYAAYDVVKKEATIKSLENEKLKQVNARNNLIRFSLIAALLTGLFIAIYVFWSNKKLKIKNVELLHKNKEIEQALVKGQNIERKRVAAELHDNLGVQANAILYNAELLKKEKTTVNPLVDQLQDTAREMLYHLRETLWAMKTEEIAAVDLWFRIVNFSKQMGRNYTALHFSTSGSAPSDSKLSASKSLQVVMIIQEAIQNAVKHALPTAINVNSTFDNTNWILTVADNGKGFNKDMLPDKSDSFGISNMKERAINADIALDIHSLPDDGTKVKLVIGI